MNRKVIAISSFSLLIVIGILTTYMAVNGFQIGYEAKPYSFPNEIVIRTPSPGKQYFAEILHDKPTNNYFFAVSGKEGNQLILSKALTPPSGYHTPLLKVHWKNDTQVTVEVDHDFGDSKSRYEFDVKKLTFNRIN